MPMTTSTVNAPENPSTALTPAPPAFPPQAHAEGVQEPARASGATPPEAEQEGIGAGVVTALGELAPDAIVTETALARIFGRHAVTIKRAVAKGELPPPVRLFGGPVWTAGAVLDHLRKRLDAAQKEVERDRARVSRLGAAP